MPHGIAPLPLGIEGQADMKTSAIQLPSWFLVFAKGVHHESVDQFKNYISA